MEKEINTPEKEETTYKTLAYKLAKTQAELQELKIKKTGKNTGLHFEYFELSDFLPSICRLCNKNGVATFVSFDNEKGTLTAVNTDDPCDTISVTSPLRDSGLRTGTEIQKLGASETYTRRYLFMALFNITEPDAIDAQDQVEEPKKAPVRRTTTRVAAPKPAPAPVQPAPATPQIEEAKISPSNLYLLSIQEPKWVHFTVTRFGLDKRADLQGKQDNELLPYLTETQAIQAINGLRNKGYLKEAE